MNQLTVTQALANAQTLGLERLDGQLLLLYALGKPGDARAWLLAHDTDELNDEITQAFRALSLRRASGEPLAYIVGSKEFFGLKLQVDSRVLVPRPDTETLVQWSLDLLQAPGIPATPEILDLGTGSGAIALAIAHSLQSAGRQAHILAVDASADALLVARENARQLALNVAFLESHWLHKVSGHFHLIVSNPPYIAAADPHLAALAHEPLAALTAGEDGLNDIRQIIEQAPAHLRPGGWLLLEHGYDQAERVHDLLARQGFLEVQSRQDLAGIARCSGGQWPASSDQPETAG
ncbi:[protein release factor]-glutamine N5-methyltransferase [Polaromonas sp. OV174]|uniref:peptide chain release factor N(5)-glutamine methyltransferase n=1 Tax=Polaromonas sp. OV174 TaxID=1855300 RepID=UPI0008F40524|nr:peptide chain release factor N(5)-glutamine methyltransferase [Polaromonas sp. OV174]SFB67906.1 [protein release factor]-glutamine N5-methyltransferase [Polaromonas sp. OV174]